MAAVLLPPNDQIAPVMLPIHRTSKAAHREENAAEAPIQLSKDEFEALDRTGRRLL
jgi:hypothetical protein